MSSLYKPEENKKKEWRRVELSHNGSKQKTGNTSKNRMPNIFHSKHDTVDRRRNFHLE